MNEVLKFLWEVYIHQTTSIDTREEKIQSDAKKECKTDFSNRKVRRIFGFCAILFAAKRIHDLTTSIKNLAYSSMDRRVPLHTNQHP